MDAFSIAIFLLALPLLLQLALGSASLAGRLKVRFSLISLLNIVLQSGLPFLGIELVNNASAGRARCGIPLAAYCLAAWFALLVLFLLVAVQLLVTAYRMRKSKTRSGVTQ